jgi:NADPH:quinone reductase-like Zn-dependent oxidoreductase
MKAYEYRRFGLDNLAVVERDEPRAVAHQVVVKFHAASLNYRDLMFAKGIYNPLNSQPCRCVTAQVKLLRWANT